MYGNIDFYIYLYYFFKEKYFEIIIKKLDIPL
jgi:hypothetical protein